LKEQPLKKQIKENQPTPQKKKKKKRDKIVTFCVQFCRFQGFLFLFFPEHVLGEVVKIIQSYISLYIPTFAPNKAFKVAEN
jgi:hypothetical protein